VYDKLFLIVINFWVLEDGNANGNLNIKVGERTSNIDQWGNIKIYILLTENQYIERHFIFYFIFATCDPPTETHWVEIFSVTLCISYVKLLQLGKGFFYGWFKGRLTWKVWVNMGVIIEAITEINYG